MHRKLLWFQVLHGPEGPSGDWKFSRTSKPLYKYPWAHPDGGWYSPKYIYQARLATKMRGLMVSDHKSIFTEIQIKSFSADQLAGAESLIWAITYLTHTPVDGHNLQVLRPYQIVSLWDMIKFNAHILYAIAQDVELVRSGAHFIAATTTIKEIPEPIKTEHPITLKAIVSHCRTIGLNFTAVHVERMLEKFEGKYGGYDCVRLDYDSNELHMRLIDEIQEVLFLRVPKDRADYYGQIDFFGPEVAMGFPSTKFDIEEAANCYATDRNTACVFHSMRVLEHGLRALAADLHVTFPTPIELENWQNIIEKIESQIRKINEQPKGLQKSQDLQFYSEAAKEFRYFKDAWRNHVSHSREKYGDAEVYRVLVHVKDFMRHLTIRLKE